MNYNNYTISLTTIPSRFDEIHYSIDSLISQTYKPLKIVLNIPLEYNFRMRAGNIPDEKIKNFIEKYKNYNVVVNRLCNDYGPGTKLLGLLDSTIIDEVDDEDYVVLVDDDLQYRSFMIEKFNDAISNKLNIDFASYYVYIMEGLEDLRIGQGADAMFIKARNLQKFSQFYNCIANEDYINYHDDLYISYYCYLTRKYFTQLELPDDVNSIYDFCPHFSVNALHLLNGRYSRMNVFTESIKILKKLHLDGEFDFLFEK